MRMMIAVVALAATISITSAQSVLLTGDTNCGTWIDGRTQRTAVALENFLEGLLNGMALTSMIEFWDRGGVRITKEQVFLWMDNYCRTNPHFNIYLGAMAIVNERTDGEWDRGWDRR